MKHLRTYYIIAALLSLSACYDDEFDTGGFSVPARITFAGGLDESIDPLLRNKLTFTAIDDIAITVNATNLSELAVTAVREEGTTALGTLSITNEQATLNTSWSELGDLTRLEFTGAADREQPFTKRLEIIQASPLTLNYEADGEEFITPGAVNPGETFAVYYELTAANTPIEQVTFQRRIGTEGEFAPVETVTVNATSADQQQVTLAMPTEEALHGESLFIRIVVRGANGLTYEEVITVEPTP